MRVKARKMFPVGLGFGLVLAGVSAAALWRYEQPDLSRTLTAGAVGQVDDPAKRVTPEIVEAVKAEVKRELTALRLQLSRVDRNQESISREINEIAEAGRAPAGSEDAGTPALNPEEEDARAQAQIRAQIELLEGARRAEPPDPQWAGTAQLALHEAFQSKAVTGLQVVETDCRTTLCRSALFLDGSASPQTIFRELIRLAPWQGQSLVHLNVESGEGVVYLAREGYSLP